ncbi:ThiF family adenylyltransferase [Frankia sp. AgB1.9]|uniref:ThiF family adenylyltransferase n=1 Tax=unclassified Frankia TaxID=2632575 RepID=UPI0019319ECE|nr:MULTISPECIES: ThiF family adenylyltransferase [unclassified Frankia]MBL7487464.1 ThiF family adenylyltransferase [Frankia sp. AgW1.1]MBL7547426.1 ThiF family adenylyltransferase [Frankia sp. AgB1.9]MBL7618799.1 ThiF family adenylyltransferase [Frankia sp. AgB1.8]
MKPEPSAWGFTPGQFQAFEELSSIADDSSERITVGAPTGDELGNLVVDVALDLADVSTGPGGVRLDSRETIRIRIPEDYPFGMPRAEATHLRWAGTPHVQFGRYLCLYASPELEWDAPDGMYGYLQRLFTWLERAAKGEVTEVGQPLHPPVAYSMCEDVVVLRKDIDGQRSTGPWLGVVVLRRVNPARVDVVGWVPGDQALPRGEAGARNLARAAGVTVARDDEILYGSAIILTGDIGFEYPLGAGDLVEKLAEQGVSRDGLVGLLGAVRIRNAELAAARIPGSDSVDPMGTSSYVLIGTPSLGIAGAENRNISLVAWKFPEMLTGLIEKANKAYRGAPSLSALGAALNALAAGLLSVMPIEWATVLDAREEVVTRRDACAPTHWLSDRRVLVLGAGALGAPVVEAVCRAGAAEVTVVDNSIVTPGILVRQPYADAEIGLPKAEALVDRLRRLGLRCALRPLVRDAIQVIRELDSAARAYDMVIDATANRAVRTEVEQRRSQARNTWPAAVTLAIGHTAEMGIACVSLPLASGGPIDILRRTSLAARNDQHDVVEDFFPDRPRTDLFHPEPGCSDATFVGGFSDTTGLAGQLLTGALGYLTDGEDPENKSRTLPMAALVVRAPARIGARTSYRGRPPSWFTWANDLIVVDAGHEYEVRLSSTAMAVIRDEAQRCRAEVGTLAETGGTLLGAFDHALRVVWVDEATKPPPDSTHSDRSFVHGTQDTRENAAKRSFATGRVTQFVGMWHTHPHGIALPSWTDEASMTMDASVPAARRCSLFLIVGGEGPRWSRWLDGAGRPDLYARVVDRTRGLRTR